MIDLKIIAPTNSASAASDSEPPPGGVNPRPHLKIRAGTPLVLQFILINAYPHGRLDNVSIRYFIVRADGLNSRKVPLLTDNAIRQGEVVLNFKPKSRVGARFPFQLNEPGVYLVRVETRNTRSDHEHFAAIDLEVE